jgi:hypothetical protein
MLSWRTQGQLYLYIIVCRGHLASSEMKEKLPAANVRTACCKNITKFELCMSRFARVFRTTPEINTDYFATQY